jgi:hypothetical protein
MHEMLRWPRANGTVCYAGLDVPSSVAAFDGLVYLPEMQVSAHVKDS